MTAREVFADFVVQCDHFKRRVRIALCQKVREQATLRAHDRKVRGAPRVYNACDYCPEWARYRDYLRNQKDYAR